MKDTFYFVIARLDAIKSWRALRPQLTHTCKSIKSLDSAKSLEYAKSLDYGFYKYGLLHFVRNDGRGGIVIARFCESINRGVRCVRNSPILANPNNRIVKGVFVSSLRI